jgi:NitT/TauT family transport system permease protein
MRHRLAFLLPILLVLGIWEAIAGLGLVESAILPSPLQVLAAFRDLLTPEPVLLSYLAASLSRLAAGYATGCVAGVVLGLMMGSSRPFNAAVHPVTDLLISVPTICWVPVLLITVGPGDATVVIAVFLGCVFPVAYATLGGVRSVGEQLTWSSQAMGARRADILFRVLLPGALPSVITGLRLATGYSWRALVGAEMLAATTSGVGYMIYSARAFYDVDVMFVGLVAIALGGLAMDYALLGTLERRTTQKWGLVTRT